MLVQRKPGNKPGGLKRNVIQRTQRPKVKDSSDVDLEKEDECDADGSADAEGLKAGHDGEGPKAESHDIRDGGDGD